MFALLNGHLVEQALHVAAVLGIADRLAGGPLTATELAADIGVDASALYRLLRTLAIVDIFACAADDRFGLTPLGDTLRDDSPNSLRDRAVFYGSPEMWPVWGNLLHSVRAGRSACEHLHDTPFYQFLIENPDVSTPFNRYMSKTSAQHSAAILDAYDFAGIATLADIGGGHGGTLAAILGASRGLHGVLFDLPEVVERNSHLDSPDITARSRRAGGDMERGVPAGADAYLLKWVLMDRPDDRSVRLLPWRQEGGCSWSRSGCLTMTGRASGASWTFR
jgi:hypothetical protein